MCLSLTRLELWSPTLGYPISLTEPLSQQIVSWQGSNTGNVCLFAVATKKSSWGQVKALYR